MEKRKMLNFARGSSEIMRITDDPRPEDYAPPNQRPVSMSMQRHFEEVDAMRDQIKRQAAEIEDYKKGSDLDQATIAAQRAEIETVRRMASNEHQRAVHYEKYAITLAAHLNTVQAVITKAREDATIEPYDDGNGAKMLKEIDEQIQEVKESIS